jgi:YbbR domain-containing protein
MEKLVKQIINRPANKLSSMKWPKNLLFKLLSLFFAVFLWYFVAGEDRVDTNIYVPVEIVNLPRNMVISNQYKKQLEVTISGPRGLVNGINRQHISRTINLSKAKPGTTVVVHNETDSIRFPRGIDVLRIQPASITLLLDRLIEKNLPIKANLVGTPRSGYEFTGISLEPPSIMVTAPQAELQDENTLVTEPIEIEGLKESTTTQVSLVLSPAIFERIGETVVSARIEITEKSTEKTIKGIPVEILPANGIPAGLHKISPDKITVHILLPLSMNKKDIDVKSLIQAQVDAVTLPPGKHPVPVVVTAPAKVKLLEVDPPTVTLEILTQEK